MFSTVQPASQEQNYLCRPELTGNITEILWGSREGETECPVCESEGSYSFKGIHYVP